jgi:hypothetical protein
MIKRGIVEPEFEQVDKTSEENQPENEPKPAPFPPLKRSSSFTVIPCEECRPDTLFTALY